MGGLNGTLRPELSWFVRTRTRVGEEFYEQGVKEFSFFEDLRDELLGLFGSLRHELRLGPISSYRNLSLLSDFLISLLYYLFPY